MRFGERIFGERVQEIVEALGTTLDASIDLMDGALHLHHLPTRNGRWLTCRDAEVGQQRMPNVCEMRVAISERWTLRIFRKNALHHDVEALAAWSARNLAAQLPSVDRDDAAFPPVDGGGTPGPAEAGIPVSWVRKTLN